MNRHGDAISGRDFAGVVAETEPSVTEFAPGDAVFGTLRGAPGDGATWGSLTQELVVPAAAAVCKPDQLGVEVAAALGVAAETAYGALRALAVGSGDVLVISAAAGGVGSLASQLAKRRGATVIGIAGAGSAAYLSGMASGLTRVSE